MVMALVVALGTLVVALVLVLVVALVLALVVVVMMVRKTWFRTTRPFPPAPKQTPSASKSVPFNKKNGSTLRTVSVRKSKKCFSKKYKSGRNDFSDKFQNDKKRVCYIKTVSVRNVISVKLFLNVGSISGSNISVQ
jgi:hypothetical protein